MRISDWSSYVCSSDLDHRQTATEPQIAHQVGEVCDLGMHHQRSRHLHAREVHTVAHVVHTIGHALVRLDLLYLAEIFADMLCRGGVVSPQRHPRGAVAGDGRSTLNAVDRKSTRLNTRH